MTGTKYTLHTANRDDLLWVTSGDPSQTISAERLGCCLLDGEGIQLAKRKAAEMLGVQPAQIETATYLKYYEQ